MTVFVPSTDEWFKAVLTTVSTGRSDYEESLFGEFQLYLLRSLNRKQKMLDNGIWLEESLEEFRKVWRDYCGKYYHSNGMFYSDS